MPRFRVDQQVWVRTSITGDHEETGVVLDPEYEDEDCGILVRLDVSSYKMVFGASQLRPLEDEEEEEETFSRRTSRRNRRSVITPSPRTATTSSISSRRSSSYFTTASSDVESSEDEEAVMEQKPAAKPKKTDDQPSEDDEKKPPAKRKKKQESVSSSETEKPAAKKPSRAAVIALQNDSSEEEEGSDSESDDGDDDEHKTFQVDYAPTSRATCRRCDQTIAKGSLRVSHVPLFRGKPGFRVYRHAPCAMFDEHVQRLEDVGGWRALGPADREVLTLRIEEAKMEMEVENEEIQPDELVQQVFQGETRSPAKGLVANLLPFQVEGVSWMYHQEVHKPEIRGGILADEMGMGKTIQAIATILDNRPLLQHSKPGAKHPPSSTDIELRRREEGLWAASKKDWAHEMEMNNVPKKLMSKKHCAARAGTLVVCPLIALSQWKTEIEKFTAPNSLSVGTYHGPNRAAEMPAEMIQKYDIVLTTYQVLEQDFRKMVSPNKVKCPNCGGKFKIDKLRVHLTYFCGEAAERTEAQSRQRRGSDNNNRRGGRPSSKQSKGDRKKKPPMTKSHGSDTKKKKSTVRIKRMADYDSDSDLSVEEEVVNRIASTPAGSRPSRGAAQSAIKKMASSVKEWGAKVPTTKRKKVDSDADEESSVASWMVSESSEDEDGNSSSSDDEPIKNLKKRKVAAAAKSKSKKGPTPLERARQKQAEALAAAKTSGGKGKKRSKKPPAKKKMAKGKGKKKFSDESSSSSSDDEDPDDPMAGIDLDALMAEAMAGSKASLLHAFCWFRIVLDEAHFIKSRSSQTAASAFALTSIHRWCLSGTPLQNRVGELYSLIRFLRIDPMAHYFCRQKGCNCKSIHYRMQHGKCLDCDHRTFSHYAHFNRYVLGPIQRDGYTGDGRQAMFKLKNEVLDKCLLRRTKETRAEDMNLPPRLVSIRSIRLHPVEEDFYEALYTQTKSSFDDYVAEGTLLNNYAHIFDLLTKMRQAVDHPYLIVHSKRSSVRMQGQQAAAVANGTVDCEMCHEQPTERVVSSCCGAGFCRSCVIEYLTGGGGENTPCPSCRNPFTIDLNQASSDTVDDGTLTVPDSAGNASSSSTGVPSLKEMSHVATGSILRRINLAEFATSTKIEVLVQELIEMRQKRPGSKALVFSQFTSMLDLVRWRLHSDPCLADLGLGVRILHGGMDVKSRDLALKEFREENSCRVLLMSLKAAGVALNLTVASECFLLDLWWNPAAEMQAIDRCHRLGQHRPIRAVRFVAEGTVEERVLQLQEKKRLVFDGTVGRDAGSLKMLTAEDMKALFA